MTTANTTASRPTSSANGFRVLRNSRVATKTTFATYEKARQWVRAQLRKSVTNPTHRRVVMWDSVSRNPPNITSYGYSIRKVA